MKKWWIGTLLFFAFPAVYGQLVYFVDAENGNPVQDVVVYTADFGKSALSRADGSCDLRGFEDGDRLIIKHLGYAPVTGTKAQLVRRGNRIYLEPSRELLEEVVMTASPFQQKKQNVPQKVVGITRDRVVLGQPQTSADLLEQTGQVYVQKSQLGGGSPMIRGFSTNRLLITVDGVRMNNAIFRGGNIQNIISIDPLNVASVEVIFGPASVIYGSDALGGAQNFITRAPRLSQTDSLYTEASAQFRTSSANNERTLHADFNLGKRRWAWYSGATYQEFGDLRMGRNGSDELLRPSLVRRINGRDSLISNPDPLSQTPTGFGMYHFLNKLHWIPTDRLKADFALHYSTTTDYDRFDRLTRPGRQAGTLRSAEWYYGPQTWLMGMGKLTYIPRRGNLDRIRLTTAYQNFGESRHNRDFGEAVRNSNDERVQAYSVNLDTEWDRRTPVSYFAGLEFLHNRVSSTGSSLNIDNGLKAPIATRYPDGSTWNSLSAYAQLEYERSPGITWLAGLRYSHFWLNSEFSNEFYEFPFREADISNGALTGNLGFSWRVTPGFRLKSHLSTGFRAPNVDDIGKIFDPEPGFVIVPNPDLGPEYVYNGEVSAGIDLFRGLTWEGTLFYSYLEDAIVRGPGRLGDQTTLEFNGEENEIISLQNAANARIYGFETSLKAQFTEQWRAWFNLSSARGTETDQEGFRIPVRHVPPLFGDFHLIRKTDRSEFDFFVNFNGPIPFDRLAESERNKAYLYQTDENGNPHAPGWYTLNARVSIDLGGGFTTTLAAENLLDVRYRRYSSGIAAPGLNLIGSLTWRL